MNHRLLQRRVIAVAAVCALANFGWLPRGEAADEVDAIAADVKAVKDLADALGERYLKEGGFRVQQYVQNRLIEGENLYRLEDYQRAAIVLMELVDNYAGDPLYSDAVYYFADSLFLSGDVLGAREWFVVLLGLMDQSGAKRFRVRALARLVEISLRLEEYKAARWYLKMLGAAPGEGSRFIKGKYLYFVGDYTAAAEELAGEYSDRLLALKAAYYQGAALTKQKQYDQAVEVFEKAAGGPVSGGEQQRIVDLLNLGLGRLYNEVSQIDLASQAYERVPQGSEYFDTALYENAAVLIRAGASARAERLLEILTVMLPDSAYVPHARLLRGNMLLRAGRWDEARKVFEGTVQAFTPVLKQLNKRVSNREDAGRFIEELAVRGAAEIARAENIPSLVFDWISSEPAIQRSITMTTDLHMSSRSMIRSERLVRLLKTVLAQNSAVNVLPVYRDAVRASGELLNRLAVLQVRILNLVPKQRSISKGEYLSLQRAVADLPLKKADYVRREQKARAVYDELRQELSRQRIVLERMDAMVVAIESFTSDPRYTEGVPRRLIAALRGELSRHRAGVEGQRDQLETLIDEVETERLKVGVGDDQHTVDHRVREQVLSLTEQVASSMNKKRLSNLLAEMDRALAQLKEFEEHVAQSAQKEVSRMASLAAEEEKKLATYQWELEQLREESDRLLGEVTLGHFDSVREKFHDLVIKADVGILDIAWMRKESHGEQIKAISGQRLREIRKIDREFQEVRSAAPGSGR